VFNENHDFPYNAARITIDKVMYGVIPKGNFPEQVLGVLLNSIFCALQIELNGSLGLGEGALFISVEDSGSKILVLKPELIDSFQANKIFIEFCRGAMSSVKISRNMPDRRALDDIIFDVLGLTQGERDAVYEAVVDLVRARLEKARSV